MKRTDFKYWANRISSKLKLDTGYFLHGSFWGSIQQSAGLVIGLFLSYMFGHFTSKQVFGEYNLILAYLSMFTFLSLPGLDTALVSTIGKGFDSSFPQAVKQKLKHSLLGTPILFTISLYYFYRWETHLGVVLLAAAALFPLLNGFSIYPAFLTGKRKFKELSLLLTFASCIFLLTHVLGIIVFKTTFSLVMAYIIARAISDIIGFFYSSRFIQNQKTDDEVFKYGSFLTVLTILPWISGHIGSIVLVILLGTESLAIYAVASRFLTAVQKNFIVFYKPVTAKLATQSPEEHLQILKKHATKLILMGFALTGILFISTPYLVRFFFTSNYQDAILYGQIMSFTLIPLPLTWVLSDILVYQKKRRTQIIISVVPHVIKIALYFLLIPHFKIYALVYIVLIERFTDPLIPLWSILRHLHKTRS